MSLTDPALFCWLGGGAVAVLVTVKLACGEGLPVARTVFGLLLLGLAIVAGARIHALVLEDGRSLATLLRHPEAWPGSALRLPGGLLLATVAGPLIAICLRLPYLRFSDVTLTAGAAFLALGRIGCHLAGCCVGLPSKLPWSISYGRATVAYAIHAKRGLIPAGAPQSAHVHPFAIYLSLSAALVFFLLVWIGPRVRPGARTLVGLALLGLAFGSIEGLRDGLGGDAPALYRQQLWLALGGAASAGCFVLAWLERPARNADACRDTGARV